MPGTGLVRERKQEGSERKGDKKKKGRGCRRPSFDRGVLRLTTGRRVDAGGFGFGFGFGGYGQRTSDNARKQKRVNKALVAMAARQTWPGRGKCLHPSYRTRPPSTPRRTKPAQRQEWGAAIWRGLRLTRHCPRCRHCAISKSGSSMWYRLSAPDREATQAVTEANIY